MAPRPNVQPSLETIRDVLLLPRTAAEPPNLVPLCATIRGEFLTPILIYLKVSKKLQSTHSFLFESANTTGGVDRYSFIGASPRKIVQTGPKHGGAVDPMPVLERELKQSRLAVIPGLELPPMMGGAVGYVGYDCVQYFEPRTKREMKDVLEVPESLFMLFDTVIAYDHASSTAKIVTCINVPDAPDELEKSYKTGEFLIRKIVNMLQSDDNIEALLPHQPRIARDQQAVSNIGQSGYEAHVAKLKTHISEGDIIQAVPSQRFARPTTLHPFNIYRHLRTANPSPYMFYVDCAEFQIVGASPEVLVKTQAGRVVTHPIAGTVKRGRTAEEDEMLAEQLRASTKDRAEHVMLVDLARNDVNRVCDPLTTQVDRLMAVQKFSHVQHLVSEVSGVLRAGKTRFDAFKSIFPAGTVSGAPKVRAMELIAELEGEKRGVYAGAVGYFGYDLVRGDRQVEGAMDTCIALRTMLVKQGVAYLQAGGGIVHDSDPTEEWEETINKLKSNTTTIRRAEADYMALEADGPAAAG